MKLFWIVNWVHQTLLNTAINSYEYQIEMIELIQLVEHFFKGDFRMWNVKVYVKYLCD